MELYRQHEKKGKRPIKEGCIEKYAQSRHVYGLNDSHDGDHWATADDRGKQTTIAKRRFGLDNGATTPLYLYTYTGPAPQGWE